MPFFEFINSLPNFWSKLIMISIFFAWIYVTGWWFFRPITSRLDKIIKTMRGEDE